MKRVMLILLAALALPGQQGSVVFNSFSATVKGVTIGASHVYFWSQSPAAGQVQIARYFNGTIVRNEIAYQVIQSGDVTSWTFGAINGVCPAGGNCGIITWQFTPGATPNSINYSITGDTIPSTMAPGTPPFTGTF